MTAANEVRERRENGLSFHVWLRVELARADMDQKELGKLVGVSAATVNRWVLGRSQPRPEHLLRLAKVFDIPREVMDRALAELMAGKRGEYGGMPDVSPKIRQYMLRLEGASPEHQRLVLKLIDEILEMEQGNLEGE